MMNNQSPSRNQNNKKKTMIGDTGNEENENTLKSLLGMKGVQHFITLFVEKVFLSYRSLQNKAINVG